MNRFTITIICVIFITFSARHAGAEGVYGNASLVDKGRVVINGKIRNFGDFKIRTGDNDAAAATRRLIRVNGETVVVVDNPGAAERHDTPETLNSARSPDKPIAGTRRVRLSDFKERRALDNTPDTPQYRINNTPGSSSRISYDE
ncbi:MAG: hypothetical protein ABIL58_24500 [Pseudomonadota bacterium]